MKYITLLPPTIIIIGAIGLGGLTFISRAQQQTSPSKAVVTFEEVPASVSKITWVHDNGRSELRHLPETCGGGGLFFDYDNAFLTIKNITIKTSDEYLFK